MYIAKAAIRYDGGEIMTALRHYKIIFLQAKFGIQTILGQNAEDGFITNSGEFVDRNKAKEIAVENGQLPANFKGVVYSEDLWPDKTLERDDD